MADYNLVIPDVLRVIFQEAFTQYQLQGGSDSFDNWALKELGQSLLPFLQSAQYQRLVDAWQSLP